MPTIGLFSRAPPVLPSPAASPNGKTPPLLDAIQYPRQVGVASNPTTVWIEATGVGDDARVCDSSGAHEVDTRSTSTNPISSGGTLGPSARNHDARCEQSTGTQLRAGPSVVHRGDGDGEGEGLGLGRGLGEAG